MADGAFFRHEGGCYLTVDHPSTDPGIKGWSAVETDHQTPKASPLGTLVPTKEEWESISTVLKLEKLNTRTFCNMVQKNIKYKESTLVYDAQIWFGEDLTGSDLQAMLLNLSMIYIDVTDATLEREQRARELYRKVTRFVKAM
eukprot:6099307-Amphidinium_carterae.1